MVDNQANPHLQSPTVAIGLPGSALLAPEYNRQVAEMLDYYLGLEKGPKYALMIKGPWGCGKSRFLQDYFKKREAESDDQPSTRTIFGQALSLRDRFVSKGAAPGKKAPAQSLWVSLYGMTSTAAIDEELFRQLHPVLGSKAARITGRFLMAGLKLGVKLPDDITLSGNAPTINAGDFRKQYDAELVLVFDDLERCGMSIPEVLGYINNFVELGDSKVIVVANDDEISASEHVDRAQYIRTKEKLIGTTVQIEPDVEAAFTAFAAEAAQPYAQMIEEHRAIAVATYRQAGFGNLRSLRHAILDFTHLLKLLDAAVKERKELMGQLMERFVALSSEVRAGRLNPLHVPFSAALSDALQPDSLEEERAVDEFKKKFASMDCSDPLLQRETWQRIFGSGLFDKATIKQSLNQSKYFTTDTTPIWLRLGHFKSLTEVEYQATSKAAFDSISEKSNRCLGEIKHIVALLLHLSDEGALQHSEEEVLRVGQALIVDMRNTGELLSEADIADAQHRPSEWKGVQFISGNARFHKFMDFVKENIEIARRLARPQRVSYLLALLQEDVPAFVKEIVPQKEGTSKLARLPLARFVRIEDFISAVISLQGDGSLLFANAIEERYRQGVVDLLPERVWLKRALPLLEKAIADSKGQLAHLRLKPIRDALEQAIHETTQAAENYRNGLRKLENR